MSDFLSAFDEIPWHLPDGVESALEPTHLFLQGEGGVPLGLQVMVAVATKRPKATDIRKVWKKRLDGAGFPLMLVVTYLKGGETVAAVCGPAGESPKLVFDVDLGQVERVCAAALRRPPQPEPPPKRQLTDPVSPARAFKKALEAGLVTHDRRRSEILQPKWGNVKGRRRLRVWAIPVTRIWPIRGKDCRSTPELASRLARNHSQTEILESVKRRTQIKALNAQPKSLSTHSPRP